MTFEEALMDSKIEYKLNVDLASVSSFKIGGIAKCVCYPANADDVRAVYRLSEEFSLPVSVIGRTSNSLFLDSGFDGILLSTIRMNRKIEIGKGLFLMEAGCSLTKEAYELAKKGWSGLEFAYGIPGSIGGAVFMNAGAYGSNVSTLIRSVTVWDKQTKEVFEIKAEYCLFCYRHSVFMEKPDWLILSAVFQLTPGDPEESSKTMAQYKEKRTQSQPLDYPSIGSIFIRPNTGFAGKYIEDCGLKGYSIGGAEVSVKHAGFIINKGKASAKDVLDLVAYIQNTVRERFRVDLEPEIRVIG